MAIDLTGSERLRKIIRSPLFPALLQWVTLGVFAFIIVFGWNYHDIRGIDVEAPLVYTNVTTLFFWVIWLMGLILIVPLVGRLWCTVCPLGYLNDLLARFGWRRRYPLGLRNLYPAAFLLIFYNGVTTWFKVNHYPDYTARLLLGVTALLVAVGVVFRGRVFCGYLCPLGGMVGVYSRVSPWRLEVRDRERCRTCESKACYTGQEKRYLISTPLADLSIPFRRPGCQVDLFPPELADDPRCVMCTQCIKNCPYDNVRWGSRPFLGGLVGGGVPDRSEAFFTACLLGAALAVFTRVWPALDDLVRAPAALLAGVTGLAGGVGGQIILLAWSYALLPLTALWGVASAAWFLARSGVTEIPGPVPSGRSFSFGPAERSIRREEEEEGWRHERLTVAGVMSAFTPAFVPVVVGAHAAFALVKLNEKVAYLPSALRDPTGVKFYLAIHSMGIMAAPGELLPLAAVRWAALLLVVLGTACSLYAVRALADRAYEGEDRFRRRCGAVFGAAALSLGALLAVLVYQWLF
jgi:hypothetical protein